MKRVFVDTGAFFAHVVTEDSVHERARALFAQAKDEHWASVTTNVVVFETYTLFRARARNGRALAFAFLDAIRNGLCEVVRVTPEDEAAAEAILRAQADKEYSFFDALSFAVMDRLDIEDAISFDRHFREYGRVRVL